MSILEDWTFLEAICIEGVSDSKILCDNLDKPHYTVPDFYQQHSIEPSYPPSASYRTR